MAKSKPITIKFYKVYDNKIEELVRETHDDALPYYKIEVDKKHFTKGVRKIVIEVIK